MTIAYYSSAGDYIDYTPSADVAAGDVVFINGLIGIAHRAIPAGELGSLATKGIFRVAKSDSSGPVFSFGDEVFFNRATDLAVTGTAGAVKLGVAAADAADDEAFVSVKLVQPVSELSNLVSEAVNLTSGSKTLDAEDVGKRLVVTGSATNVINVPATVVGYQFAVEAASDGLRIAISPAAADKIMGPNLAGVDNKDLILTAATAKAGDLLVITADGVAGYYVHKIRGVWAAEA